MVQARQGREFVRSRLVELLPRLRRLATLLAGGAEAGDALLERACRAIVDDADRYSRQMPFAHWALAGIYALWLDDLRTQKESLPPARADAEMLRSQMDEWAPPGFETVEVAAFLASLPPQQRIATLLVYGEGLSYAEAARVLDTEVETVASRVSRALALLVERLGLEAAEAEAAATPGAGTVEQIAPRHQPPEHDQASP